MGGEQAIRRDGGGCGMGWDGEGRVNGRVGRVRDGVGRGARG